MHAIIAFFAVFILALIFIYLIKQFAQKLGLIDIPNERSTHVIHTPRGAGIGFFLAVLFSLALFQRQLFFDYPWTFVALFFVFVIGVLDDMHDTSPNTKFIVFIIATVFLSFDGLIINNVGTYFGVPVTLGWFALPFTMFAVSGFTNAMNLIDGIDGLAATVSIIIFGAFLLVGYRHEDMFIVTLSLFFIAALAAFLVFNWHPASIFMGDSGSLTLGFAISVLAIKSLTYLPTVSILFIAALPIFDTLIVMTRRKRRGRSIFSPDRCHMHHIIKHFFKEDTRKTVIFFGILQAVYSITGLLQNKQMDEGYLMVLFLLNTFLLYMVLGAMIKRQKREC